MRGFFFGGLGLCFVRCAQACVSFAALSRWFVRCAQLSNHSLRSTVLDLASMPFFDCHSMALRVTFEKRKSNENAFLELDADEVPRGWLRHFLKLHSVGPR